MISWLLTLYLVGTFLSIALHQAGYKQDVTILSILATGAVGLMNSLFNNKQDKQQAQESIMTHTCPSCGKQI